MRVAHLADAHLGFRQFQRLDPRGVNQREADVAAAFGRTIEAIIARQPDAVIIAGDLFHAVRPTNRSIIEAFSQLARLRRVMPHVPVALIAGNHDTPRSAEAGSILGLMRSLGVDVVDDMSQRLHYPELNLSLLAVPHADLLRGTKTWLPDGRAKYNVLVMHPEIAGYFPEYGESDYGGVRVEAADLGTQWNYVALGHYHICTEVAPRAWYSGSLEYTSSNIWLESKLEKERRVTKGFQVVELEKGIVERVPLPPERIVHDLPSLDASGMSARDLDAAIQGRIAGVAGGIADTVTRLVVWNAPRELAHELDHAAIRALRAQALHFHLDLRRPEPTGRTVGVGGPGSRLPLPELVESYLSRRPLDAELDRTRLVALGREFLEKVDIEYAGEHRA